MGWRRLRRCRRWLLVRLSWQRRFGALSLGGWLGVFLAPEGGVYHVVLLDGRKVGEPVAARQVEDHLLQLDRRAATWEQLLCGMRGELRQRRDG